MESNKEVSDSQGLANLVTQESIRNFMPEWDELTDEERAVCHKEMIHVMSERANLGMSALTIGESLTQIHAVLAPKRLFFRFCEGLNYARSTVNNYIASYRRVRGWLLESGGLKDPQVEVGLRTAMAKGLKIHGDSDDRPLGVYTEAVKRLPAPPRSEDVKKWGPWWDGVEEERRRISARSLKKILAIDYHPDELAVGGFRRLSRDMQKLRDARKRRRYLERVIGAAMHSGGFTSSMTFAPEVPPENFIPVVGRPKNPPKQEAA